MRQVSVEMNTEALLRMLEQETRQRVTGSRRWHSARRVARRVPTPRTDRRVF